MHLEIKSEIATLKSELKQRQVRRVYTNCNNKFELSRKSFYRQMENTRKIDDSKVKSEKVREFWAQIYKKKELDQEGYRNILNAMNMYNIKIDNPDDAMIHESIVRSIKLMPNCKAPGPDKIYNFWWKRLTTLHQKITESLASYIKGGVPLTTQMTTGRIILIPKSEPANEKNYRPICLLNGIYKIYTRTIKEILYDNLVRKSFFSDEQLGTIKDTQGAKEQSLYARALSDMKKQEIGWLDVAKAYNIVDHQFMRHMIKKLPTSEMIRQNLNNIIKIEDSELIHKGGSIGKISIQSGVKQGDSLNPLLFVCVMQCISNIVNHETYHLRKRNEEEIPTHLLFVDDIRIVAEDKAGLDEITEAFVRNLSKIGMIVNEKKSGATVESVEIPIVTQDKPYRYLGIYESKKKVEVRNKNEIMNEIYRRTAIITETKLGAKT
eukprot:GAHX01001864.1.p1 GENE.GAHX01001864.1~~GAHX01001864.1.p1  ORF type:complete len:436 (-),score=68.16 GAHX01001864.1:2009-3316(-)